MPGPVHQCVLVDPADAGGVGAEFGANPLGQPRLDLREVFERAAAGPVQVGAVLEDDVNVREAEVGKPPDRLDSGGTSKAVTIGYVTWSSTISGLRSQRE